MTNEQKKQLTRYLVQRAQRDKRLWAIPDTSNPVYRVREDSGREVDSDWKHDSELPDQHPVDKLSQVANQDKQPDTPEDHVTPEPVETIPIENQLEDPFPDYQDVESFRAAICNCKRCPLGETRNQFVFGTGDPNASLVIVGEAPGADEDRIGEPFVGRAGKLLDKILAAIDMKRGDDVFIGNILKCRPPMNRDPKTDEVEKCEPFLLKQLQLIKPKLILALGRISAQTLLRTSAPLGKLREKVHDYHGIPLVVTFHPAALLRNPNWKRPTWEDVQNVQKMLEEMKDN